jgi:carbamoylphosphate synthase small subunit
MLSVVPVVCRAERVLAQKGSRLFSTNVPKTPEQIKQAIEKTERLAKFMQRPGKLLG